MNEPDAVDERRFAERFRADYSSTPMPDSGERARLANALAGLPRRGAAWHSLRRWFEPRGFVMRPVVGATVGLALIAAGVLLGPHLKGRAVVTTDKASPASAEVRFALVMKSASSVSLVGDFNGWDAAATPMRRDPVSGVWMTRVPLAPGWHSYAFIVDGDRWVADPQAPLAPADGFGHRHSVVVVEGREA